jgi:hypothetical protein
VRPRRRHPVLLVPSRASRLGIGVVDARHLSHQESETPRRVGLALGAPRRALAGESPWYGPCSSSWPCRGSRRWFWSRSARWPDAAGALRSSPVTAVAGARAGKPAPMEARVRRRARASTSPPAVRRPGAPRRAVRDATGRPHSPRAIGPAIRLRRPASSRLARRCRTAPPSTRCPAKYRAAAIPGTARIAAASNSSPNASELTKRRPAPSTRVRPSRRAPTSTRSRATRARIAGRTIAPAARDGRSTGAALPAPCSCAKRAARFRARAPARRRWPAARRAPTATRSSPIVGPAPVRRRGVARASRSALTELRRRAKGRRARAARSAWPSRLLAWAPT